MEKIKKDTESIIDFINTGILQKTKKLHAVKTTLIQHITTKANPAH